MSEDTGVRVRAFIYLSVVASSGLMGVLLGYLFGPAGVVLNIPVGVALGLTGVMIARDF